jgi:hypothetical protein
VSLWLPGELCVLGGRELSNSAVQWSGSPLVAWRGRAGQLQAMPLDHQVGGRLGDRIKDDAG